MYSDNDNNDDDDDDQVRSQEPITQMVRVRVAHTQTPGPRQAAGEENCAELEKMWVDFNSSASATATNLNNPINESPANTTRDILEAICARWVFYEQEKM